MKSISIIAALLVTLAASGCGGTYVKIVNNTQNNFGTVTVKSTTTDTNVAFSSVNKTVTTDQSKWPDNNLLTVQVVTASPATTDKTGAITLDTGKVNTITLTDGTSSSELKYTVSAQ